MYIKTIFGLIFSIAVLSCNNNQQNEKSEQKFKPMGNIERLDAELDNIISKDAKIEIIADGFEWSEGPLWVEAHQMLLFSDVPMNTIYKWTEAKGKEVYLKPSGYTGIEPPVSKEPGSNGLTLDHYGKLVLCQHGDRRMARMDAPLDKPEAKFITLADKHDGKRFSSPNDAVYDFWGELYFTDPPYGLQTQDDNDSKKEIKHNGVYKIKQQGHSDDPGERGTVVLLTDSITRPNGLAFLPFGQKLIVSCSDPNKPNWYIWDVKGDSLINGKIFYSAAEEAKTMGGLPDGLKIDKNGNVFATGPGGIYIFNKEGKKLGMIKLENSASNCALSPDEKMLYVTNDMYVLRIKLRN
ncbi:MAG: SMP-30/gluconolactonase/LRE family protein [Bacteroidetes bacterium]|nr:MAG: SMP-30/gluconolactonase/LRE family protein [Bacteroidota bacterium]